MSSPPHPPAIDDGTPMNVSRAQPETSRVSPELNGQPDQRVRDSSPSRSDDNPDNIRPAATRRQPNNAPVAPSSSTVSSSSSSSARVPASPMQQDDDDDAVRDSPCINGDASGDNTDALPKLVAFRSVAGDAASASSSNITSSNATTAAAAAAAVSHDERDALPKLFRPAAATSAIPGAGDNAIGKSMKGSVEAWSSTDYYALPPAYPSMGKVMVLIDAGLFCIFGYFFFCAQ